MIHLTALSALPCWQALFLAFFKIRFSFLLVRVPFFCRDADLTNVAV